MAHSITTKKSMKSIGGMRIKCAAIRYNKENYEGSKHALIGLQMIASGICSRPYPSGEAQGFVTECGKFVSREAALKIAINAGQVEKGKTLSLKKLYSEDLK